MSVSVVPFQAQGSVVLDATGSGSIRFQATAADWNVTAVTVSCSTRVLEAEMRVYRNYIGDMYLVDSTYNGSSGDTSDTLHVVPDGEALVLAWSKGDPGATANAVIRGTQTVPDRGFRAGY